MLKMLFVWCMPMYRHIGGRWLRQSGAAWPQVLANAENNRCWCAAAVAWARAEGCAAPVLAVDADGI
jgi:hypothetical protein